MLFHCHKLYQITECMYYKEMDCFEAQASISASGSKSPSQQEVKKMITIDQQQQHQHQAEETSCDCRPLLLTFQSPLDPDTEYHVVWAKKSLWKRRLEHLQQRYPNSTGSTSTSSSCCQELSNCQKQIDDDDDDDDTWLMDGSHRSIAPWDRSGDSDSSESVLSMSIQLSRRWGDYSETSKEISFVHDDHDDDARSSRSCFSDIAPSLPCRAASPPPEDDGDDDSDVDGAALYTVTWLEDFYSTVTDIRRDGLCSAIQEARSRRASIRA